MAEFLEIDVRLHGPLADLAGASQVRVSTSGGTVDDVLAALQTALPGLRLDGMLRLTVNTEEAGPASAVSAGDVVSLIPGV